MPNLYHDAILELKRAHNQMQRHQKLLFPSQLTIELMRYPEQNPTLQDQFNVCKAFEKNRWFFSKTFFPSLQQFYQNEYTRHFKMLKKAGLLTGGAGQDNFNAVLEHQEPYQIIYAVNHLKYRGLLTSDATQANFNAVITSQHPYAIASTLNILDYAGLLTGDIAQTNRDAVIAHLDPTCVVQALAILNRSGLLASDAAQTNFDALITHQRPSLVVQALNTLASSRLLTSDAGQGFFDAMVAHPCPDSFAEALVSLKNAGLLTGNTALTYFVAMVTHQQPNSVATILSYLKQAGLLAGDAAQANFNAVIAHQQPNSVAAALIPLRHNGLFTGHAAQANFNAVVAHQQPNLVAKALRQLELAGLLRGDTAQANFDYLVITHTAILLHSDNNQNEVNLWDTMPYFHPNATEFRDMVAIAQYHAANPNAGSAALRAYVNTHILDINHRQNRQQNNQLPAFNTIQSTHTASVHASVSQSAKRLLVRYNSNIAGQALDGHIQQFASSVQTYKPDDHKQRAAARCISRLMTPDYTYTDNVSQVSLKQLVGLVWIAIHDKTVLNGTLSDAKHQLIEGLYEIQRGYNLSDADVDDNAPQDRPICIGGTFNKFCEKLAGMHPDVSVLYITKAGATTKLRIVAVEEAQKYLSRFVLGSNESVTLQDSINDDNMQPLWDIIAPQVSNRLFEEFGSLYPQGITSPNFVDFVSQGIYALTSDKLVLPNASRNQASSTTNLHALFQPHGDDDLGAAYHTCITCSLFM